MSSSLGAPCAQCAWPQCSDQYTCLYNLLQAALAMLLAPAGHRFPQLGPFLAPAHQQRAHHKPHRQLRRRVAAMAGGK